MFGERLLGDDRVDRRAERVGRESVGFGERVGVHVERDRRFGMAQVCRHDLDGCAHREHHRRGCVSSVVESGDRQARFC